MLHCIMGHPIWGYSVCLEKFIKKISFRITSEVPKNESGLIQLIGKNESICHKWVNLSPQMRKPTICIGKNKGADQLRSNCIVDQRLYFRYMDSIMPLLSNPKFQASTHLL